MSGQEKIEDVFCRLYNNQCFRITNLKISLKERLILSKPLSVIYADLASSVQLGGRMHNFLTFKKDSFTFTLFSSGHVNITGIKSEKQIPLALFSLCQVLPEETSFLTDRPPISLGNLSATGKLGVPSAKFKKNFSQTLERFCENHSLLEDRSWNPELFAGYTIRTPHGSLVIFSSGSINILGVKEFRQCEFFEVLLNQLLMQCSPPSLVEVWLKDEEDENLLEAELEELWLSYVESNSVQTEAKVDGVFA